MGHETLRLEKHKETGDRIVNFTQTDYSLQPPSTLPPFSNSSPTNKGSREGPSRGVVPTQNTTGDKESSTGEGGIKEKRSKLIDGRGEEGNPHPHHFVGKKSGTKDVIGTPRRCETDTRTFIKKFIWEKSDEVELTT